MYGKNKKQLKNYQIQTTINCFLERLKYDIKRNYDIEKYNYLFKELSCKTIPTDPSHPVLLSQYPDFPIKQLNPSNYPREFQGPPCLCP